MPRSKVLRSRLLQAQELLHLLAEVMMPRHRVIRHTSAIRQRQMGSCWLGAMLLGAWLCSKPEVSWLHLS